MRRVLISTNNSYPAKALRVLMFFAVVPFALVASILVLPFNRPIQRSPKEVARYLRDFLEGEGGDWDWDDFTSLKIADPQLEDIRVRAANLDLPIGDSDITPLKALIEEAETLAALDAQD